MASILQGYEYDIFISYRQNDNRSGWVSEFVKGLREELATVTKFPVSVYLDVNPHDGVLETHNVDQTLQGKLKCLIFIPIISQTYCDSKGFAWNNEFMAFKNLAQNDAYKVNIRLANGNIASRILPIRIHDLDSADQSMLERELGGALRAIDFIYRTPGVNRPLRSQDDDIKEVNHALFYRDQINKVANAVRELLIAIETPYTKTQEIRTTQSPTNNDSSEEPKSVAVAIAGFSAIAAGTYFYETLIVPAGSPKIPIINGVTIILFLGIAISLFFFLKNRRTRLSRRWELILVLVAAFFYLLVAAGIGNNWQFSRIEEMPGIPWLFISFVAVGPALYYWMNRSKRSKVIFTASILSILAMAIHIASTDYFGFAILLIITSIVYYLTIPAMPLNRSKLVMFVWMFSLFVIAVHLLFSKDEVTALTILLIFGPVFYYFIGEE